MKCSKLKIKCFSTKQPILLSRSCRLTNVWLHVKKMHNRKGTHQDVEVFEDELKQMQAMELVCTMMHPCTTPTCNRFKGLQGF